MKFACWLVPQTHPDIASIDVVIPACVVGCIQLHTENPKQVT